MDFSMEVNYHDYKQIRESSLTILIISFPYISPIFQRKKKVAVGNLKPLTKAKSYISSLNQSKKTVKSFLRFLHQEQKIEIKKYIYLAKILFKIYSENMSPRRCAACKYLRRKCPPDCTLSPYFPPNDPQRFACVHRIYGASNVVKMLQVIN